jgi:aldehyde dehydrogenase (NAD+)
MATPLATNPYDQVFQAQKTTSFAFRSQPIRERLARLRKIEKWLLAHRQDVIQAVQADFYRPATEIEISETMPVLNEVRHALADLERWVRPKKVDAPLHYLGTRSYIRYEPKGVCLIIAPWNYPFNLCMGPLVSALAAGNTAIVKPSEFTPNTGALVKKLAAELFSPDQVTVVEGDATTSQQLLALPFDHIFFTGSPTVGKLVMKAAAEHLASVTLELGGKSPTIVDGSNSLADAARRIAFGKFFNNGQTCIAPDYVLVKAAVQQEFVSLLQREIQNLFGAQQPVTDQSPDYARLVHQRHFDRIGQLVEQAAAQGANVHRVGEPDRATRFYPPTLLTEVPATARVLEEEIFGPVLPLISYQNDSDVFDFINTRPKPLGMYVFSNRAYFRKKLEQQTSSGALIFNDCLLQYTHPNIPFGGVNNSGIGKAHGQFGFQSFSNEKPVIKQMPKWANTYFFHPPYTPLRKWLVDFVLRWML